MALRNITSRQAVLDAVTEYRPFQKFCNTAIDASQLHLA